MAATTDEVVSVYLETGDYQETATRLGLGYDAVRKRIKRRFPPGSSTLVNVPDSQIKLQWLRTPRNGPSSEEVASQVLEALENYRPPAPLKTALRGHKDLAALVPLVDLHVGLRVWGAECGKDWDLDIAKDTILSAYRTLFSQCPKVKKAFILGVGDLLHVDNYQYQTGTPGTSHVLDADGRYPKTYLAAVDICISICDLALMFAEEVELKILPGNHDVTSAVGIAVALYKYYTRDKRVTVDIQPGPHWATSWGSTMLAASHGDKLKPDKMPGKFSTGIYAETWGKSKWRHFFCGHYHQEKLKEFPGCTVEILGTPIAADSYANDHGFISSQHVHCRIYHKDKGEILRPRENII